MSESPKKVKLVGEFIKKRREVLGISQRALGLLFEPPVTTQFISNVERGVTPLPPTHIPILAKALSTPDGEIMALLEKEYALKLNGRMGKAENIEGSEKNHFNMMPGLTVSNPDYEFMKNLYEAYRLADPKTREAFVSLCADVLKSNKIQRAG